MQFKLIGLIIPRPTTLVYPELLPELVKRIEDRGYRVMLSLIEHEGDIDPAMDAIEGMDLASLVVAARPSEQRLSRARAGKVPVLLYNCHAPMTDSISCDHAACGRLLASMLLEGGHRRFGLISGPSDSLVATERLSGALHALDHPRTLVAEVVAGDYSYASGVAALDTLFAQMKPRPSAIIAMNDAMALGALDRARALQVRVPRDLSVVGIDGTTLARLPVYRLATVRQPLGRMASAAAEVIAERIAHRHHPAEARLFAGELLRGETARFERRKRD